jgi:hypothetical protein
VHGVAGLIVPGDFINMMAAFDSLRTERQALATLKAKLDQATKWLEDHPAAK